jgi:serine/threonine protein kinase
MIEVALERNYNEKCDVYSFAILLWQMYSLKTPYELYNLKSLKARVWAGEHKRPLVDTTWPVPVKSILKRSWSKDIKERPGFQQITKILRGECVRVRDGNEDGLEHCRRRSTFVFRGSRGQLATTKTKLKSNSRLSSVQRTTIVENVEEETERLPESAN